MSVRDISEENMLDVFRICSASKLEDRTQLKGIQMKRRWLRKMMKDYGPCTKIAYVDTIPVAQILFYPEEAVPYIPHKRDGVIILHCAYNPFVNFQRRGVASSLIESLVNDSRMGLEILDGRPCEYIVAKPFMTGEGLSLDKLYTSPGFIDGFNEMYREIFGTYEPQELARYTPLYEDRDRAVLLYEPVCEWNYVHMEQVKQVLEEISPKLKVDIYNIWEDPDQSIRRGNQWLVVNAKPIKHYITDLEAFKKDVEEALAE